MLVTAQRLRRHYQALPADRFVYYPFHVPADVALTLRAAQYFDQCALIDYLARTIPATHRLAIKEHPALVGATPHARLADVLRRYDNIVLLQPTINNHDVLSAADLVVTVNSKSGAEALLHGRRVVVLGDAFYRDCDAVRAVDQPSDLPAVMRESLARPAPSAAAVRRFFQRVWDSSYPGELYATDPDNCRVFATSVLSALNVEVHGAG
jgi:capsule polysaccharide modification protein KpsS